MKLLYINKYKKNRRAEAKNNNNYRQSTGTNSKIQKPLLKKKNSESCQNRKYQTTANTPKHKLAESERTLRRHVLVKALIVFLETSFSILKHSKVFLFCSIPSYVVKWYCDNIGILSTKRASACRFEEKSDVLKQKIRYSFEQNYHFKKDVINK